MQDVACTRQPELGVTVKRQGSGPKCDGVSSVATCVPAAAAAASSAAARHATQALRQYQAHRRRQAGRAGAPCLPAAIAAVLAHLAAGAVQEPTHRPTGSLVTHPAHMTQRWARGLRAGGCCLRKRATSVPGGQAQSPWWRPASGAIYHASATACQLTTATTMLRSAPAEACAAEPGSAARAASAPCTSRRRHPAAVRGQLALGGSGWVVPTRPRRPGPSRAAATV